MSDTTHCLSVEPGKDDAVKVKVSIRKLEKDPNLTSKTDKSISSEIFTRIRDSILLVLDGYDPTPCGNQYDKLVIRLLKLGQIARVKLGSVVIDLHCPTTDALDELSRICPPLREMFNETFRNKDVLDLHGIKSVEFEVEMDESSYLLHRRSLSKRSEYMHTTNTSLVFKNISLADQATCACIPSF